MGKRLLPFKLLGILLICLVCFSQVGHALLPLPEPRIVINTASRTLTVFSGKQPVKSYSVGVGKAGFETPLGNFRVINKVVDPIFEDPFAAAGKRRVSPGSWNPLGTRWIGFKEYAGGEYGIHGTNQSLSVGKLSSHGCVRMLIPESEELFDMVDYGTPVDVIYEPVIVTSSQSTLMVTVFPDDLRLGVPSLARIQNRITEHYPGAKVNANSLRQALQQMARKPVVIGQWQPGSQQDGGEVEPVLFKLRISN